MLMNKNFKDNTYVTDSNVVDTITWLMHHQESFDSFEYDAITQQLKVHHANGTDLLKTGQYLNASYGILITSL